MRQLGIGSGEYLVAVKQLPDGGDPIAPAALLALPGARASTRRAADAGRAKGVEVAREQSGG